MSKLVELEAGPAEITWLGRLDNGVANKAVWSGNIPAAEYWLSPTGDTEFKKTINDYYVRADFNSSIRCIDGRPNEGVLGENRRVTEPALSKINESQLGPQVPGGSPAAALSYRVAKFNHQPEEQPNDVLLDDLMELYRIYQAMGMPFKIGAHDAEGAKYPNTGCGAIDNLPAIMERMVEPEALPETQRLTQALLGDDYDENVFMEVVARLHYMNQPEYKKVYLQRDDELGTDYKDIVLAIVKKEADEDETVIERKIGAHKEWKAICNKRRGETFSSDLMSLDTNNETQIFNFDIWFVEDAAKALFPNDEAAQKLYVASRTMYFIATAMVLTNGELEAGSRE